jgi:single-strand DNA-binding protein
MPAFNNCTFVGHLGRDPELKYLASGDAVVNFSLAVTEKWKDKKSGEKKESTLWLDIVAFKHTAEFAGQYLAKGQAVLVSGKLRQREWETEDGQKRSKVELVTHNIVTLGKKAEKKEEKFPDDDKPLGNDVPF